MTRYKIIIEYEGSLFVGWQRQKNGISVQESIEDAIFALSGEKITLFAAGRTDAGVHALGQVAHFDLEKPFDPYKLGMSLNHFVRPHKISIISCEKAFDDFHARFTAKKRYYKYIILNRSAHSVIYENQAWHIHKNLDIEKMKIAASYLEGKHDFSSFRAKECQAKSAVKTLDKIEIIKDGDFIILYFSAQSFLHHMVRNIVGTLKMVGEGILEADYIKDIIEAKDRAKAGITAPSCGLYFLKVDYENN